MRDAASAYFCPDSPTHRHAAGNYDGPLRATCVACRGGVERSHLYSPQWRLRPHPEDTCGRCSQQNASWHTPSPLWNAVMRDKETGADRFGIVCPVCFIELAAEKGIVGAWCLKPHGIDIASLWQDADGRTWDAEQCLWVSP